MKNMPEKAVRQAKPIKWMKIFKLCLAVIPPIVFGIFPIIFTIQQNNSAKAMREQDQQQADETNRRIVFKEYIDDMKELLLKENFNANIEQSLLYIRIETLSVLRHLDPERKRDLIVFLYENHLLRHDHYPQVELVGADLNGLSFIKSPSRPCSFPSLYLPGISAADLVFEHCYLPNATFNGASMPNARFHACHLAFSSFTKANLSRTQWLNNHLFGTNFTGASLVQSKIKNGVFQRIDLTNADLYQSEIAEKLLDPIRYGGVAPNTFTNARYPNGSFSLIKQENLVVDSDPDSMCRRDMTSWVFAMNGTHLPAVNTSDLEPETKVLLNSDCIIRIPAGVSVAYPVNLMHHSLLVDLEQLTFNLTVILGLINGAEKDEIAILVYYSQEDGIFDYMSASRKAIVNPPTVGTYSIIDRIPRLTELLLVAVACNAISSADQFCFLSQAYLSVFR